jgi:hypothetical protein
MAKACLFAIVWRTAIWFIPRRADMPFASDALAFISAFFPIIVAVNMGYNAAWGERRRPTDEEDGPGEAAKPPSASTPPPSDAITAETKPNGTASGTYTDMTKPPMPK